MSEQLRDRLIDCLLREELGGQGPPDVFDAVMARAFPSWSLSRSLSLPVRNKKVWAWASAGLAAAAAIAVIAIVLSGGGRVQQPAGNGGDVVLLDGKAVPRGTVVATEQAGAQLDMGGYARVQVASRSSAVVEGASKQEAVSLRQGQVACEVDSNVGTFAVRTQAGTAWAAGTKFSVRVLEAGGADGMPSKRMMVHVQAGAVLVNWGSGQTLLAAGEEGVVPPKASESNVVTGVVTAKGDNWLEVKADGAAKAERYTARWIGGLPKDGGAFDKDMVAAIAKVKVGDTVEVKWTSDERKRVMGLTVLGATTRPTSRPAEAAGGTVTGAVTGKGENWVEVTADGAEKTERYIPVRSGGGPDKDVLAQIAKVKVGEKVTLKWTFQEHKRVLSIEAAPAAK